MTDPHPWDSRSEFGLLLWNGQVRALTHLVSLREVPLVDSQRKAAAGINVKQLLANGHIAECFHEWEDRPLAVERDRDVVAEFITKLCEGLRGDVEDEVAEWAVGADDLSVQVGGVDGRVMQIEADQLSDVERGTGLRPIVATGRMGAGWGEDVATVKRGGDAGANHPGGVGDLVRLDDAVAILDEGKKTVVREYERLAHPRPGNDGLARRPDTGIDDDDENRVLRKVRRGAGQKACAHGDVVGLRLVGDVDNADAGGDAVHDCLADAYGIVFDVEVGHEADDFRLPLRWSDEDGRCRQSHRN